MNDHDWLALAAAQLETGGWSPAMDTAARYFETELEHARRCPHCWSSHGDLLETGLAYYEAGGCTDPAVNAELDLAFVDLATQMRRADLDPSFRGWACVGTAPS